MNQCSWTNLAQFVVLKNWTTNYCVYRDIQTHDWSKTISDVFSIHVLCSDSATPRTLPLCHACVRLSLQLNHLLLPPTSPPLICHTFLASQTQLIIIICSKLWIRQGGVGCVQLHKHPRQLFFLGTIMAHVRVVLKSHWSIGLLYVICGCTHGTQTENLVQVLLHTWLEFCGSAWNRELGTRRLCLVFFWEWKHVSGGRVWGESENIHCSESNCSIGDSAFHYVGYIFIRAWTFLEPLFKSYTLKY